MSRTKYTEPPWKSSRAFFTTRAAQIGMQSLDLIADEESIGMAIANPGVGKSEIITRWLNKQNGNLRYVWIEADVLTCCRPLLKALIIGLKLTKTGSLSDMKHTIAEALAADPLMFIIDEADQLRIRTFDLIRSIWDETSRLRGLHGDRGFPLAMFGTSRLRDKIMHSDLERLYSRTMHFAELPPMNRAELVIILSKWGVKMDSDTVDKLLPACRGSFRWLKRILDKCYRMKLRMGGNYTPNMIKAAEKHLLGLQGIG